MIHCHVEPMQLGGHLCSARDAQSAVCANHWEPDLCGVFAWQDRQRLVWRNILVRDSALRAR